jgi:hypothetical protein
MAEGDPRRRLRKHSLMSAQLQTMFCANLLQHQLWRCKSTGGDSHWTSDKAYSGTMRLRPTPSTPASISAVW